MTLESRMQALLDLVEADRARQCDAIIGEARACTAATLAAAHAEARRRMRSAFEEERERRDARVAAAQAKLQTHRRLHDQRRATALLAAAWQKLPEALCERWRAAQPRRAWVSSVVTEARAALPRAGWRIVHAAGWPDAERAPLVASLARELDAPPEFVADKTIHAGLKVAARGNVIDGTLAGLLMDRAEIGAKLLQHLENEK
jgi:hypothetical protein